MKSTRFITSASAVILAHLTALGTAQAEIRAFTDTMGRTLRGELVGVTGDFVTIKREADGQSFTVKASGFSSADINYFKEHGMTATAVSLPSVASAGAGTPMGSAPLRLNVAVYPKKSERSRGNMVNDKIQKTNYKIEVKNSETQRSLEKAHGTLISFGRVLKTPDESQIIGKEEFDTGAIKALGSFTYESQKAVHSAYDSWDQNWGVRYTGYLFVLKDPDGKVLQVSGSSETLAKHSEELLKLGLWDQFDKSYKKTKRGTEPSSD